MAKRKGLQHISEVMDKMMIHPSSGHPNKQRDTNLRNIQKEARKKRLMNDLKEKNYE